jgi:hypothetical protein
MDTGVRFGDVKDLLDRAATSVPLDIADGNGKYGLILILFLLLLYFLFQRCYSGITQS